MVTGSIDPSIRESPACGCASARLLCSDWPGLRRSYHRDRAAEWQPQKWSIVRASGPEAFNVRTALLAIPYSACPVAGTYY
jgi:hypothetical protein